MALLLSPVYQIQSDKQAQVTLRVDNAILKPRGSSVPELIPVSVA